MLARRPYSGYDLSRALRQSIGYFWNAFHSQVYPELASLEAAGLVTHEVVEQQDRPDKKVYSITERGRAVLREWASEPAPIGPDRDEFMLKAYSMWMVEPARASAFFRHYEAQHTQRLAAYEEIRAVTERDHAAELARVDSPVFASYATLRRGIEYERGYAAWCREMAETFERAQTPDSESGGVS